MPLNTWAFRTGALAVLVTTLSGCSSTASVAAGGTNAAANSSPDSVVSGSTTAAVTSKASTTLPVVANGNGWNSQGLEGHIPVAGSYHYRHSGTWVLPDPRCTPGSTTPLVDSANLHTTICKRGYSASVRPPVSLTEPAKYALMRAYGLSGSPSLYEFDHLIPLELGGSSNLANLWPEPDQGTPSTFNSYSHYGLNAKDGVESQSNYAVCDRGYSLGLAQKEMAQNWVLAHQKMPN